jgi:hypothetical protein
MAASELGGLTERWAEWVRELADHPLDQYEYLGLPQHRDAIATWPEVRGDSPMMDSVDEIDADFEGLTVEDSRYAERFSAQAGGGNSFLSTRIPSSTSRRTGEGRSRRILHPSGQTLHEGRVTQYAESASSPSMIEQAPGRHRSCRSGADAPCRVALAQEPPPRRRPTA